MTSADLLERVERLRREAGGAKDAAGKSALGQFFTPAPVARQMAAMLDCPQPRLSLLDAGAGIGSLLAACVAQWCQRPKRPEHIHVTAYEVDTYLLPFLHETVELCSAHCQCQGIGFTAQVLPCDFLQCAAQELSGGLFSSDAAPRFTCAILNPPYKKIHSQSDHRKWLRQMGVETSNLYTGFLAAAMQLLAPGGEMVAITPRSFCNGPYFTPFRRLLLQTMSLHRLHVYDSREQAFRDDKVLQENIIFHAVKGAPAPDRVVVSRSAGPDAPDETRRSVAYTEVVPEADAHSFIHLPSSVAPDVAERMARLPCPLAGLGLKVSTGRVVDFRARPWLRMEMGNDAAPLIYPTHLGKGRVTWPLGRTLKPCALAITEQTRPQFVPNAHYVLVKRFSTKEETKRVVATVYQEGDAPGPLVGFENHLNYFHAQGKGLNLALARGLALFLNSPLVETYFRQFNGHTQVNATDLRSLRYPTAQQLRDIGGRTGTTP